MPKKTKATPKRSSDRASIPVAANVIAIPMSVMNALRLRSWCGLGGPGFGLTPWPACLAGGPIWLSPVKPFPYTQGMEKLSKLYFAVFTTKFLASIACFLAGVLLMKGLGNYYGFNGISALAAQ
jgi:hypothetical protein